MKSATGVAKAKIQMPSRISWLQIPRRLDPIAMRRPISPRRCRTRYQKLPITQSRMFNPKKIKRERRMFQL